MKKLILPSRFLRLIFITIIISQGAKAWSQADTTFKNTIRINVTNPMIFGDKSIVLGYERVLKNNKTFSVNLGRAFYPKLVGISVDTSVINLKQSYKDRGFNISGDYRMYLKNENKYAAPRGVYLGPFYSFNYFNRTNTWNLDTPNFQGDLETELSFNIHTIGFELGYQFVFWDRMSVDMILLGPGVSYYNLKAKINTSLTPDDESKLFDAINDYLSNKIPGYDQVIDGAGFQEKGSVSTTSLGFRYMIMIGYRFK